MSVGLNDLVIAGILLVAAALQTIVGFGLAIFAIPALLFLKLTMPQAVLLTTVGAVLQVYLSTYRLRHEIPWTQVARATACRAIFIPIGIAFLHVLDKLPMDSVKTLIGVVILAVMGMRKWLRLDSSQSTLVANLFFSVSGLMAGAFGIGGPPLVLWASSQRWPAAKMRAFLLTNFAITIPFAGSIVCWQFFDQAKAIALTGVLCLPFVYLGTWVGHRIAKKVNQKDFERIVTFGIVLMALAMIFS